MTDFNCFGLVLTIVLYLIFKRVKFLDFIPVIISVGIVIILILKLFNIDYETYHISSRYLTYLIAPATIALSYPLYKNADILFKNKRVLYFGLFLGTIFAIISTYFCARLFGAQNSIVLSMISKSTTMPIAVEITKNLNGIVELTSCVVVLTGVFGGVFGHKFLKLLKIKSDIAIGLALGTASHVIGTAACAKKKKSKQVAASTIALIISGILSVLIIMFLKNILIQK